MTKSVQEQCSTWSWTGFVLLNLTLTVSKQGLKKINMNIQLMMLLKDFTFMSVAVNSHWTFLTLSFVTECEIVFFFFVSHFSGWWVWRLLKWRRRNCTRGEGGFIFLLKHKPYHYCLLMWSHYFAKWCFYTTAFLSFFLLCWFYVQFQLLELASQMPYLFIIIIIKVQTYLCLSFAKYLKGKINSMLSLVGKK